MSAALTVGSLLMEMGVDVSGVKTAFKDTEREADGWFKGKGKAIFTGGALALGGAFSASLVKGIQLQKANDKMAASMGLNAKQSARMGKVAGDLYAGAYGDSMEDVNVAIDSVRSSIKGMKSASDADLTSMTATAMDFASAFDTDVSVAASTAGAMIEQGLATDGANAFDLLTAAAQKMPREMRGELPAIMNEYSKDFAALGLSGEQAMSAIVGASKGGAIALDKTGDVLKEFVLKSSATDDKGVQETMKKIGLNGKDMANELLAGGDRAGAATQKIAAGLLEITDPGKRAAAAVALFGTPLEDLGKQGIPAFLEGLAGTSKSMKDTEGAAKKMGETLNQSDGFTKLKNRAELAFNGFAAFAVPIVLELADGLATHLGPALKVVGDFLGKHSTLTATLVGVLVGAVVIIKAISVATRAWAAAQAAFNVVMAVNPVVLVVLAIVALVVILAIAWKRSETFKKIVTGAFNAVKNAAAKAFGWVKNNWPLLLAILTGPIGLAVLAIVKNWDKIKAGATKVKDWIVDKFNKLVGFFTRLPDRITSAATTMWDGIKSSVTGAKDWSIAKLQEMVDFAKSIPSQIGNSVLNAIPGGGLIKDGVGAFEGATGINIPGLASGGYVPATPGGRTVQIAEGGQGEIVSPLPVMKQALIEALREARPNESTTINLNEVLTGNRMDNIRTSRDLAASTRGR